MPLYFPEMTWMCVIAQRMKTTHCNTNNSLEDG